MRRSILLLSLFVVATGLACAAEVSVPEIDAASSAGALTLIGGALLVIRARRKR